MRSARRSVKSNGIVARLSDWSGSGVVVDALTVLWYVPSDANGAVRKSIWIVRTSPGATSPRSQTRPMADWTLQVLTSTSPRTSSGSTVTSMSSIIETSRATDGPVFVTVISKVKAWPGASGSGVSRVLVTSRSGAVTTLLVAVAVLFDAVESGVVETTDALLETVAPDARSAAAVPVIVIVPEAPSARVATSQSTSLPVTV